MLLRAKELTGSLLAIAASVGIPLFLWFATQSYERVQAARARAEAAVQREAQVLDALSTALKETIAVSQLFRAGAASLESACTPEAYASEGTVQRAPQDDCEWRLVAALGQLDDTVGSVSWTIDTVPVRADTYARAANLKYDYFRGCTSGQAPEACGFRQRILRYLHSKGANDQQIALKYCAAPKTDVERRHCIAARESMKNNVIAPARDQVIDILCSITRDANELRVLTWTKMQADALSYKDLADRLEAITSHSDCARRLREKPIPSDCRFGRTSNGSCL